MKRRFFGTDGVRGACNGPLVNECFASRLGVAAGRWAGGRGRVLLGRDTRASGEGLMQAVARGLAAAGLEPVWLGVLPTPAVALAVRAHEAVLGVVVTASHNPASDNGIKFFGRGGGKLSDADELAIEAKLPDQMPPARPHVGWPVQDARADYQALTQQLLPAGALAGWKIVVDCAHGATAMTTPPVLRALGAEVIALGVTPDGFNINAEVGSEHPEAMVQAVRTHGATVGIAHDGDGDRCVLCDETGSVLDGDEILTVLALHALSQGCLTGQVLVVTIQSNLGVDAALQAAGARVVRTAVGDRYVIERMRAEGAQLGGESSGHVVCADVAPTGDGLVAALRVLEVMRETGKPLSELRRALVKFPQGSENLSVVVKRELADCPSVQAEIKAIEYELGRAGRVLVRYSGTEPKLRLLVEASDAATVQAALKRLQVAVRQDLVVLE